MKNEGIIKVNNDISQGDISNFIKKKQNDKDNNSDNYWEEDFRTIKGNQSLYYNILL